jgi:hypothetical protein
VLTSRYAPKQLTATRRPVLKYFPTCVSGIAQQNNVNIDHMRPNNAHHSLVSYLELHHCYYSLCLLPSLQVFENKTARNTKDDEEPYNAGNLPGSVAFRVQTRFRHSCEDFFNSLHFLHKLFLPTAYTAVGISDICNVHNTIITFQLRTAVLGLIVRSGLDVPTFATRRLHACHHARAPSDGRRNCGREMSDNFA